MLKGRPSEWNTPLLWRCLEENIHSPNVHLSASDIEQLDRFASRGAALGAPYHTAMARLLGGWRPRRGAAPLVRIPLQEV